MNWYLEALRKYAMFDGRARRKEYWIFSLINILIIVGLALAGEALGLAQSNGYSALIVVFYLAILLPSLAVGVRRLHDTGRSGWWLLIAFVPIVGGLVLLVFTVQDSKPGANEYGANPKGAFA